MVSSIKLTWRPVGVVLFIVLSLSFCFANSSFVFGQVDQVSSKLQAAEDAVDQAFGAILNAEKVGANVTGLLATLGGGADLLAQAKNANKIGDIDTAIYKVDQVVPIAQKISADAKNAERDARFYSQEVFLFSIAFSMAGSAVFVFVLFLVWHRFKKNYMKKYFEGTSEANHE